MDCKESCATCIGEERCKEYEPYYAFCQFCGHEFEAENMTIDFIECPSCGQIAAVVTEY